MINGSYQNRSIIQTVLCDRFKVIKLKLQRIFVLLIFCINYKLGHNQADCASFLSSICFNVPSFMLRSSQYLELPRFHSNLEVNSSIAYC